MGLPPQHNERGRDAGAPRTSPVWPRRLIGTFRRRRLSGRGGDEVHTTGFFSGDQMAYWMMTNPEFLESGRRVPVAVSRTGHAMAYLAIFREMTFLFVCWKGTARAFALSVGAIFHVMTYFTLGLILFPMLYIPFVCRVL